MFLLFQFLAMCFSRMNIFDRPMIFLFCHRFIIIIRDKGNEIELFKDILNHDNRYLNHFVNDALRPLLRSLIWLHVLKSLLNECFFF